MKLKKLARKTDKLLVPERQRVAMVFKILHRAERLDAVEQRRLKSSTMTTSAENQELKIGKIL